MGSVIVTYKVFPEDIVENFDALKKQIDNIKPEFASIEGYGEEPVAFGLVALLVQLKFPEDIVENFDALKKQIDNIKPEFASIEGYGEEPVAFGLVALLVQLKFPE